MIPLATETISGGPVCRVRRWRIEVTGGPSKGSRRIVADGTVWIGTDASCQVEVDDRSVSRKHLELTASPAGVRVRDPGSKNGTFFEGARIATADLPIQGAILSLGNTQITVAPDDVALAPRPVGHERCGRLAGKSEAMRLLFAQIERIAPSTATVLIEGETGTGKELVAEAVHGLSPRRDKPFVVIDCAAMPRHLLESELFGHVRGAFTGATADRRGAFEQADGGTIFLDEIGELELDLQPKLLRVLQAGTVRPVGSGKTLPVDVRVVAASLKNLHRQMQEGRFRQDLFYRLSVVHLTVPPLREHREDLPLLSAQFLAEIGSPPLGPASLAELARHEWPGNVRELRNVLERAAALAGGAPPVIRAGDLEHPAARRSPASLLTVPFRQAKEELLGRFTRDYLEALLLRHRGNVSAAAREADTDRNWIVALARRYGVRIRD